VGECTILLITIVVTDMWRTGCPYKNRNRDVIHTTCLPVQCGTVHAASVRSYQRWESDAPYSSAWDQVITLTRYTSDCSNVLIFRLRRLTVVNVWWKAVKFCYKINVISDIKPVPVTARTEAKVLIAWTLRSWVLIPLKAWVFVLVFLCCVVLCR
jgi:hypothetical protein